jgi:hypothetical protein
MKDSGLEIVGYIGDSDSRVRGHIAMGTEPAAKKLSETVREATLKENPPQKGRLKWLAGKQGLSFQESMSWQFDLPAHALISSGTRIFKWIYIFWLTCPAQFRKRSFQCRI